ncbi:hypothetical protein ATO00_08795 [Loigolactobacillus coryniformis subsp. coryniformis]|nr:hypothetical protein LC20001_12290 [Loigolactobacillus coryniformis subsp. coryniformis KCTC 3167 = DSM 20001]OEH89791.1 hypothetical protein ATO00_08795 [Loigolactobacillus coryniformis subsp. coryniformis]
MCVKSYAQLKKGDLFTATIDYYFQNSRGIMLVKMRAFAVIVVHSGKDSDIALAAVAWTSTKMQASPGRTSITAVIISKP